jgi:hypothetical protein
MYALLANHMIVFLGVGRHGHATNDANDKFRMSMDACLRRCSLSSTHGGGGGSVIWVAEVA